jgi:UDP-2-acetamido-3-amino-2,3-dideoxy-glucuronate N-acetyltransferase
MNIKLEGVSLLSFKTFLGDRGSLTALELPQVVPFLVKRIFLVHQVSDTEIRGEHAHKKCWQLLIATTGSVVVDVTDGELKETHKLVSPNKGLLIPPLIWGAQYNYSTNAALLVLASEAFDPDDYIHDFEEFKSFRKNRT